MYIALIIILFIAFFLLLWIGVNYLLALIGGWRDLSRKYAASTQPPWQGETFSFQSFYIGILGNYRSCVNVTVAENGVYLVPFVMFRIGHRPLFLPYEEFAGIISGRFFFAEYLQAQFGGKRIRFSGHCVQSIKRHLEKR